MLSASCEESRISTPMADVIWGLLESQVGGGDMGEGEWEKGGNGGKRGEREGKEERGEGRTYILQHLDFGAHAFYLGFVLVFELGEDGVGVLASVP